MKYRKKPVVVEAVQFTYGTKDEILCWLSNNKINHCPSYIDDACVIKIRTLEGVMIANINDFIIKGIKGEFYSCKPDIFLETYEMV